MGLRVREEWDRFVAARPAFAATQHELRDALRVCWLHGLDLHPDTVDRHGGFVTPTNEYMVAMRADFPCA